MGSACFVTNKRAWSIVLKCVCLFWWFFLWTNKDYTRRAFRQRFQNYLRIRPSFFCYRDIPRMLSFPQHSTPPYPKPKLFQIWLSGSSPREQIYQFGPFCSFVAYFLRFNAQFSAQDDKYGKHELQVGLRLRFNLQISTITRTCQAVHGNAPMEAIYKDLCKAARVIIRQHMYI